MNELDIISKWLADNGLVRLKGLEFIIKCERLTSVSVWMKPNLFFPNEGINLISTDPMIKLYVTETCCVKG